jgi:hypothetical protein
MASVRNFVQGLKGEQISPKVQKTIDKATRVARGQETELICGVNPLTGKNTDIPRTGPEQAIKLLTLTARHNPGSRNVLRREAVIVAKEYGVDASFLELQR